MIALPTTDLKPNWLRFSVDSMSIEPWKLRPSESVGNPVKLLVGAREGLVRGRLDGAGYEISVLGFPVEGDGWIAAWEVS